MVQAKGGSMRSRDFVHWLQGFVELGAYTNQGVSPPPDEKQWECIKRHIALVFKHEIDPEGGDAKKQEELNELHGKTEIGGHLPGHPDILLRC
jgi:hypothetical protein